MDPTTSVMRMEANVTHVDEEEHALEPSAAPQPSPKVERDSVEGERAARSGSRDSSWPVEPHLSVGAHFDEAERPVSASSRELMRRRRPEARWQREDRQGHAADSSNQTSKTNDA